jgi:hypothetical protein
MGSDVEILAKTCSTVFGGSPDDAEVGTGSSYAVAEINPASPFADDVRIDAVNLLIGQRTLERQEHCIGETHRFH